MKCILCPRLLLLTVCGATAATVTPVQKVITLLGSMLEKGKKEKHEEQIQFAAYKQFCDDTSTKKSRDVKEAAEQISMLTADIKKYAADSVQIQKEASGLDADVAVWEGDIKAATKVRAIEKADFEKTHADYTESIDALQHAVSVLKKQSRNVKLSFSQTAGTYSEASDLISLPIRTHRIIDAFLSEEDSDMVEAVPQGAAYEFQSKGVINMLEKLKDKFVDERSSLEKDELNAKHAYDMMVQDLRAQKKEASTDRSQKIEAKAKMLQMSADAKGDLAERTNSKAEDEKYLSELSSGCRSKASDFQSRQKLRVQELAAIEKAIEIMGSKAVKGTSEKHLAMLAQNRTSLGQLRTNTFSPAQIKATFYLQRQAKELNSRVLSSVALHVQDDPFVKVKKMIKDLVVRLMEEAYEEAEHKGWCDTEISSNKQTRHEKTIEVQNLNAEIDELRATISQLGDEMEALSSEVTDLDEAMAKSTKLRMEEKANNAATVRDSQNAQTAVAQALMVLNDFYSKSAEVTALMQAKKEGQLNMFQSSYQGIGGAGGVMAMLEVIESDFARLEAETSAAEATSQRAYDVFMADSRVDKASKSKDIEHKASQKQDKEQELNTKQTDLEGTQKELNAALAYYDKLKPSCVDAGVTYGDRVSRRKEEIESLQEALRILNGESI